MYQILKYLVFKKNFIFFFISNFCIFCQTFHKLMFQSKQNDVIKCHRMPRFVLSTVLLPLLSVYCVYSTENIFMLVFKGTRYILCWIIMSYAINWGFTGSSAGKESACNSGDPGSSLGLGSCPGEGIGYPLQYSWASLVTQMVKNPPAMQET